MQQYQNYYPMYQNNYGQQMQNPYMQQRMDNLQQFQQAIQQPQMVQNQFMPLGKVVESIDIVKATDIPMDGNMYYFPKADGSMVYSKKWLPNGSTQILAFKPILEDDAISTTEEEKMNLSVFSELLEGIQNDVRTLNDKVDKISKPLRTKKGVEDDE